MIWFADKSHGHHCLVGGVTQGGTATAWGLRGRYHSLWCAPPTKASPLWDLSSGVRKALASSRCLEARDGDQLFPGRGHKVQERSCLCLEFGQHWASNPELKSCPVFISKLLWCVCHVQNELKSRGPSPVESPLENQNTGEDLCNAFSA